MVIADNTKTVGSGNQSNLGNPAVKERLSLAEVKKIMSSERECIDLFTILKRLEIDVVHDLVACVDDFGFNVTGLPVFAVLIGFPHFAAEVLNGKSGNRLEVTLLAVPVASVSGQPF